MMFHMQAAENYDWRLSIVDLERRDNYFTILQNRVELLHSTNSEKVRPLQSHVLTLEETSDTRACYGENHLSRLQALSYTCSSRLAEKKVLEGILLKLMRQHSMLQGYLHFLLDEFPATSTFHVRRGQVVVLAHSWGDNVWRTFMRWVTVDDPGWVERHLAAYVNIAGTVLGVSKSTTSLLSGD